MTTTGRSDIYVVQVDGRTDDLYAFSSILEAERFVGGVIRNGGPNCDILQLPLNIAPEHTDELIAEEYADS